MGVRFIQEDGPEIKGEIHMLKKSEADNGLITGIHVHEGNLILDWSKDVQYVGMTIEQAKIFTMAMVAAIRLSEDEAIPAKDLN